MVTLIKVQVCVQPALLRTMVLFNYSFFPLTFFLKAKGGIAGLHDGAEVVLGPDTSLELLGPVPPEQQFINQKMRPGSGVLVVRVIPDGPTRVLQVKVLH